MLSNVFQKPRLAGLQPTSNGLQPNSDVQVAFQSKRYWSLNPHRGGVLNPVCRFSRAFAELPEEGRATASDAANRTRYRSPPHYWLQHSEKGRDRSKRPTPFCKILLSNAVNIDLFCGSPLSRTFVYLCFLQLWAVHVVKNLPSLWPLALR